MKSWVCTCREQEQVTRKPPGLVSFFHPIGPGVLPGYVEGILGDVHTQHALGAVFGCIEGESAIVTETVQHPGARAQGSDGGPVFLLVQEEACFLTIFYVYGKGGAVLKHGDPVGNFAVQKACTRFKPLQTAHRHIAVLVDTPGADHICQNFRENSLSGLQTRTQTLHDQHVGELVHDEGGEKIALCKHGAAAVYVAELHAPGPGFPDAAEEEVSVNGLVVPGQHAQGDLGPGAEEGAAQKGVVGGTHLRYVPGDEASLGALDVREKYSGMTRAHPAFPGALEIACDHGDALFLDQSSNKPELR